VNIDDATAPFAGQLFTDGVNTPSEFTGNPYSLGDMIDGTDRPQCEFDMSCSYCGTDCPTVADVPSTFERTWTPPYVETGYDEECLNGEMVYDDTTGGDDEDWEDDDDNWDDYEEQDDYEWDGNYIDDDESNAYTNGCVPDSFEGNTYGHVITVRGHSDEGYNGDYCQRGDWEDGYHFEKDELHHFYYYSYYDGTGCA